MNKLHMNNHDVSLAGFWQLARHWKQGHKAKLELCCENGTLQMQLSAHLGHPDHPLLLAKENLPPISAVKNDGGKSSAIPQSLKKMQVKIF